MAPSRKLGERSEILKEYSTEEKNERRYDSKKLRKDLKWVVGRLQSKGEIATMVIHRRI
jgi:hypothetical protein